MPDVVATAALRIRETAIKRLPGEATAGKGGFRCQGCRCAGPAGDQADTQVTLVRMLNNAFHLS